MSVDDGWADDGGVAMLCCSDAVAFLDALSLQQGVFAESPSERRWCFRGHGDASWPLLPRAARNLKGYCVGVSADPPWTALVNREARQLYDFAVLADRAGLDVPGFTPQLIRDLETCASGTTADIGALSARQHWPPMSAFALMALAQHHDVPTRLLDWTLNPKVAAYFAAADAAQPCPTRDSTKLCVWAMNPTHISGPPGVGRTEAGYGASPVQAYYETISVPVAGNPHYGAQESVMLLLSHASGSAEPLFQTVLDAARRGCLHPTPSFRRVELDAVYAGELLWRLALEGITGASLFPGYQGVARAVSERARWTDPR